MKTNFKLTLLFLLIAIGSAYGQTNFRDGFIITLENDTINGQIANRANVKNYKSCIFKNNKRKITYVPSQILGFGYHQGKYFSTQIIKGSFVEVLVIGKLSLFKSKSKYHLKKEEELTNLEPKVKVEENGEVGYRGDKLWKGRVYSKVKDCMDNSYDIMSKLKFDEKRLTKLVVNYNKCTGAAFTEIKAGQPWAKLEIGVTGGFNTTFIKNIKNQFDFFPHLADTYSSTNPSIGLSVSISSPRISDRIAIQAETHFIKSSYASFLEFDRGVATEFYDTYIVLNTVSLPLSLKYMLLKKKVDLYVQSGINIDRHINADSRLFAEEVIRGIVTTFPASLALDIRNTQFGYWGGVGLGGTFKQFRIGVSARYIQLSSLNKLGAFKAKNNRFSVNLTLSKK